MAKQRNKVNALQVNFSTAKIADNHSFSFEAHPWSTTPDHLKTLSDLGFNRISIGVQDFDQEILKIINRHQTTEQVRDVVNWSRSFGFESINFDLIAPPVPNKTAFPWKIFWVVVGFLMALDFFWWSMRLVRRFSELYPCFFSRKSKSFSNRNSFHLQS